MRNFICCASAEGERGLEHISIDEASIKFRLSKRTLQRLCSEGRIEGAVKYQRSWMIPADGEISGRSGKGVFAQSSVCHSLPYRCPIFIMSRAYSRPGSAEQTLEMLRKSSPAASRLFEACLCYYRFDMESAVHIAEELLKEECCFDTRICLAHILALKALYTGDAPLWRRARDIILKTDYDSLDDLAQIEFNLAMFESAIFVDEDFPEWFCRGDWSNLPLDSYPPARYVYLKHLYINGRADALAAVAGPFISQCRAEGALVAEIYLRIIAALGFHDNGDDLRSEEHLRAALELARPDGIYALRLPNIAVPSEVSLIKL